MAALIAASMAGVPPRRVDRTRLPQAVKLALLVDVLRDAGLSPMLRGDADRPIARLATLDDAGADSIAFLANVRYAPQLATTAAGAVLVTAADAQRLDGRDVAALIVAEPYAGFAALTQWWARQHARPPAPGVHPSAIVEAGVQLAASATVAAGAVLQAGCVVGDGALIGPHAVVGRDAIVGDGTRLGAHVALGDGTVVGARGLLHPGVVLGADGFGFATTGSGASRRHVKIEQLGAVVIGDDCEIGANTCIDRGALGDTVLGDGVKLDNHNQIGHNCRLGDHVIVAGCCGIAGSTRIGARAMLGGQVGVTGHLTIGEDVVIGACSVVSRSLLEPGFYSGFFPIDDNARWERNAAALRQLDRLRRRVMALERRVPGGEAA